MTYPQFIDSLKMTCCLLHATSKNPPCYTRLDSFVYRPVIIDIKSLGTCTTARLHDILDYQRLLLSSKSIFTGLHLKLMSTGTFDHVWFVPFLNHQINEKDFICLCRFLVDHGNIFLWSTYWDILLPNISMTRS